MHVFGAAGSADVHGALHSLLRTEWRPLADLAPIAAEWRELAARALEPNVFYEPAFALAAAAVFGADAGAVLVWSRGAAPQLLGLFPARVEPRRYGVKLPVLVGWTHPYAPLGTPLVDREAADAVIAAWLGHVVDDARLPKLVLLPDLPRQGPLAAALSLTLDQRGSRSADFACHARALLQPAGKRANYLDRSLGGKRRKNLRRQRKLLAKTGTLRLDYASESDAIPPALADFLALEAAGWKGRAGTAIRRNAEIADFVRRAVVALAEHGRAQVHRLMLDQRPIAAGIVLRSGTAAWFWKIAYDETFSSSSPGTQLTLDLTQALLADTSLVRVDSCAVAGHPMIDHIWRERLPIGDRLLSVGGDARFALARTLEGARRAAATAARALRDLLAR
jgi:CelD/BcsL family acetyltransferase involved in cellulose biosynthesis